MQATPPRPSSPSTSSSTTSSVGLLAGVAALVVGSMLGCTAGSGEDGFDFSTESNGLGSATAATGTGDSTAGPETDPTAATQADSSGTEGSEGSDGSTDDGGPPAVPCTAVDLLFVVDNSQPMLEEQERLQAVALAFVEQLGAAIPTLESDLHVGVITTDDPLMVQTTTAPCGPYEGGSPWMRSSSLALGAELGCALAVGVDGSPNERPMDMLLGALSNANLMPGGFHNGFLREDALLVVVLATNEEDELEPDTAWGSAGDPATWAATLTARKGYPKNVVVLSLLGTEKPNACPDFQWNGTEGAQISPRLIELTESFPRGAVGDICAQEYATFLLGQVPSVAAACASYSPP